MNAEVVAILVILAGLLIFLIGWLPTMREMFAENSLYGYLAFAFFPVALAYAAIHWDDLKRQFWFQVAGLAVIGGGWGIQALSRGH